MSQGYFNRSTYGGDAHGVLAAKHGGISYTSVTASYSAVITDYTINVISSTASISITLSSASAYTPSREIIVKDASGSAATHNIVILPRGSDLIDGATSSLVTVNFGSSTLYTDGISNWRLKATVAGGGSGISGKISESGISGKTAESGISGRTADSGISGKTAESGISGKTAESGISGRVGADGATGPQGESGISGKTADSGISGKTAESGISGKTAESGISGKTADSGLSGISGKTAESGISGQVAESGISGKTAESGISGKIAESGISGKTAESGISGKTADSGLSGISGKTAESGISGKIAESGISGKIAESGVSGKISESGISGVAGEGGGGSLTTYSPTTNNASNTTTETDSVTFTVTGNTWSDGQSIVIDFYTQTKQNAGVAVDLTYKFYYNGNAFTIFSTPIDDNSQEGKSHRQVIATRIGTSIYVQGLPMKEIMTSNYNFFGEGLMNNATNYTNNFSEDYFDGTAGAGILTSQTFTGDNTCKLTVQWGTANANTYYNILSAKARKF